MSRNYGTLTSEDIQNAMRFASDQVNRLKCEDENMMKHMCDGDENCMTYKEEDYKREWQRPGSISTAKRCDVYSYGGNPGDRCYAKPAGEVDESENDQDRIYPYCLPPSSDGVSYCGWQKSDTIDTLKMTAGTCVANNKETCMKFSTYGNERILKNADGTFMAQSTTREVGSKPEDNKGKCEPATCDPDEDDNCLPTKCMATVCQNESECRDDNGAPLPGLTGTCHPVTIAGVGYCVVDETYDCSDEKPCGGYGKIDGGSCNDEGRYDLKNISGGKYIDCWEEELGKEAKKCDTKYTTGACYGNGACPKEKVPDGTTQAYLEWHDNAGRCDNKTALYCKNGECLNGRCTCKVDGDCPGTSQCGDDGLCTIEKTGQCVYGNPIMREICEQPQCRGEATADNGFVYNKNNTLPPWKYDKASGTCFMSRPYCAYGYKPFGYAKNISDFERWVKINFSNDTIKVYSGKKKVDSCETDADCANYGDGNWKCTDDYTTFNKKQGKSCSGPGAQCASDNFGDTLMKGLVGETVYNSAKYGEACFWGGGMTERYAERPAEFDSDAFAKSIADLLLDHVKSTPENTEIASIILSKHKIESSEKISSDVVPGIDLFHTEYKNGTKGIGFSIDQVKNVIPDNVKMAPTGDEYLVIQPNQKFENPILTKLYFLLTLKIK